jgi:hypothetical protein
MTISIEKDNGDYVDLDIEGNGDSRKIVIKDNGKVLLWDFVTARQIAMVITGITNAARSEKRGKDRAV